MKELKAREGHVWTNGEIFSDAVYLSKLDSEDNWTEITEEEAMKRQDTLSEANEFNEKENLS